MNTHYITPVSNKTYAVVQRNRLFRLQQLGVLQQSYPTFIVQNCGLGPGLARSRRKPGLGYTIICDWYRIVIVSENETSSQRRGCGGLQNPHMFAFWCSTEKPRCTRRGISASVVKHRRPGLRRAALRLDASLDARFSSIIGLLYYTDRAGHC